MPLLPEVGHICQQEPRRNRRGSCIPGIITALLAET